MRGRFTTSIYRPVYKELSGTSLSWRLSLTTLGAPLPGFAAGEVGGEKHGRGIQLEAGSVVARAARPGRIFPDLHRTGADRSSIRAR